MVTLFSEPPIPGGAPSGVAISILLHVIAGGVIAILGLTPPPELRQQKLTEQTAVRFLETPPEKPRPKQTGTPAAGQTSPSPAAASAVPDDAPPAPAPPLPVPVEVTSRQTLIQPKAPTIPLPPKLRIPTVVMWRPEDVPRPDVVPLPPQTPDIATVSPSMDLPNHEEHLSDIKLSATQVEVTGPVASTTSPIIRRGPQAPSRPPETAIHTAEPPSPASIISMSDVRLTSGSAAIPFANQPVSPSTAVVRLPGHSSSDSTEQGRGEHGTHPSPATTASTAHGSGSPTTPGTAPNGSGSKVGGDPSSTNPGGKSAGAPGPTADLANAKPGSGDDAASIHIHLPKDGHFGVVVVGSTLADEFPETVAIWSGRMVYSVYLKVGSGKSWILQYSMPRTRDTAPSATRPEAAWPYEMVKPKLTSTDFTADAIMVHGFVNLAGHFENLATVLPSEFAQSSTNASLLHALQQWQFRPARQNGEIAVVEVLLIIPADLDD